MGREATTDPTESGKIVNQARPNRPFESFKNRKTLASVTGPSKLAARNLQAKND
jgi:hypothetical protein